jgi:hypothetical protein
VDALTYLISAALLAGLKTDLTMAAAGRRMWAEIGEGLRYVRGTPVIRTLTIAGFGLNMSVGGVLGLLVVHADTALGIDPSDKRIGLLYTAGAIGSLIAALALPRAGRIAGQGAVSIAGFATFVLAVGGLAATGTFGVALVVWAVWSMARLGVNANGIVVRQLLTPDELQGRVNTTGRMVSWGGTPFGALLGGLAADAYGVRAAYLLLAVPAVIGLALVVASPVRGLRLPTD